RPERESVVVVVRQGAAASDGDEPRIADLGQDHRLVWLFFATAQRSASSCNGVDFIACDRGVTGDDGQIFDLSLGDQQSIERIAMVRRQGTGSQRMRELNIQNPKPEPSQEVRNISLSRK